MFPVDDIEDEKYLVMATRKGFIKKSPIKEFKNIRKSGLIAITLREDDELVGVELTNGKQEIMLASHKGMAIRFNEADVRPMGRTAMGVKGMELDKDDYIIGMQLVAEDGYVLTISERGYGKRTPIDEYRAQNRGGKGIITMNVTEKTGNLVGLEMVTEDDELMIINSNGIIIRIEVKDISVIGRNTQGVLLMRTDEGESVVSVAKINKNEEDIDE